MSYDQLKLSIEATTGGKNTVILDDKGMPSIMVKIPKFKISDVIEGGSQNVHPAFVVDGVEKDFIYVSKYQNIVHGDRAYSLPAEDPRHSLNFDQAKTFCENKGKGWHLMTNAERSALALWCKKNGTMPRGNNNYGSDHSAPHEKGVKTAMADATRITRVATGSGPASWAHDGTTDGIYDLNGNAWEWTGGYRLMNGEIQVIPYNNAAMHVNQGVDSTLWKAIMPDGSFVNPGTPGTLKWDYSNPVPAGGTSAYGFRLNTSLVNQADNESAYGALSFQSLTAASGIQVPEIIKALGIMPADATDHGGDFTYMRNKGERLPYFGGYWSSGASAGVFAVTVGSGRSGAGADVGFRSAYVDL